MTVYYTVTGNPAAQTRAISSQMRAEFVLIQTGFTNVDASFTAASTANALKGNITNQTWLGTHTFPATTYGVTAAFGSSGTAFATLDYVNAVTANPQFPGQGGNSGKFLTTNGTITSWALPAFQTAATSAEIKAGSDNTKVVTASGLLAAQGFTAYAQTADQTITSAGLLTIAHGLGRTPIAIHAFLKNVTTQAEYVAGDIIAISISTWSETNAGVNSPRGVSVYADSTNLYVRFTNTANVFAATSKTAGNYTILTNANWSFFLRAFA